MARKQPGDLQEIWSRKFRKDHAHDVAVMKALAVLEKAGCEMRTVDRHLMVLERASRPDRSKKRRNIHELVRRLRTTQEKLEAIVFSQFGMTLDPDGRFLDLHRALDDYANYLESASARVRGNRHDWSNLQLQRLTDHVRKSTGRAHHSELGILIGAVIGYESYGGLRHRIRRLKTARTTKYPQHMRNNASD